MKKGLASVFLIVTAVLFAAMTTLFIRDNNLVGAAGFGCVAILFCWIGIQTMKPTIHTGSES